MRPLAPRGSAGLCVGTSGGPVPDRDRPSRSGAVPRRDLDRVLPPDQPAANEALLAFLADAFAVPRRQVELFAGAQSRQKRVRVLAPERARAEACCRQWGVETG